MIFLTIQDVLTIHDAVLERHGGRPGILDPNQLNASVYGPQASYDGEYLYQDEYGVAAAYSFLGHAHAFNDGNKRTAWACIIMFLRLNGILLSVEDDDAIAFMLVIAQGQEKDWEVIADWIRGHALVNHE